MSAKLGFSGALVLSVLGVCAALGGEPSQPGTPPFPPAPGAGASSYLPGATAVSADNAYGDHAGAVSGTPAAAPGGNGDGLLPGPAAAASNANGGSSPGLLSSYITYTRPECCGPIGCDGPIMGELYVRTGPSLPFGDGILAHSLETGWEVMAGGRSLFFNKDVDRAWTVDLGISYMYNHARSDQMVLIGESPGGFPEGTMATPRDLNRTFGTATLGREWYLNGPANVCGWHWRAGFDAGGRLGTAKLNFQEIKHGTDTIYGYLVALHTDVEKPWGPCCTLFAGFRAEWDFTREDLLGPGQNANVQDVNLLMNFGVRF